MVKSGEVKVQKAGTLRTPRSMMFHGQFKHGKTSLVSSIINVPKIKKVALFDIDLGAAAIGEDFPDIDVITFKRGDIKTFEKRWDKFVENDGEDYDAAIIDTMTILQGWKAKSLPKSDGYAKWEDVSEFTMKMMWDLHEIRPIGISTFHTSISNAMKGADEKNKEYLRLAPALQGSAKQSVGAVPDIIGFCDIIEGDDDDDLTFTVRLKPSESTISGNRFRKLPALLDASGGIPRMFDIIKNGL